MQMLQRHYVERYLPLSYINLELADPLHSEEGLILEAASGVELELEMNKKDVLYVSAEGMSQASRVVKTDIETCIGVMHIIGTPLVPDSNRDAPREASDSRAARAPGSAAVADETPPEPLAEQSRVGAHACNHTHRHSIWVSS